MPIMNTGFPRPPMWRPGQISDTTLSQDRGKKLLVYAKAKIPIYWIVNLVNRQVEVYSRRVRRVTGRTRSTQPASKCR